MKYKATQHEKYFYEFSMVEAVNYITIRSPFIYLCFIIQIKTSIKICMFAYFVFVYKTNIKK